MVKSKAALPGRSVDTAMPIYEYAAITKGCPHCEAHFDLRQKMSDAELTVCPQCGAPVRRVLSAPNVAMGNAHTLKESNVAKGGFTQYRRAGNGVYEKTVGKGPKFISGD
jgi:putative FmdB family regulatory protein